MQQKTASIFSSLVNKLIILVIVISCINLILQTEPSLAKTYLFLFKAIEITASIIFALEYIFRLTYIWKQNYPHNHWQKSLRYIFSFLGIADLMSFLPSFCSLLISINLNILIALQLVRLFKLTRYSSAFNLLKDVLKDEAESLMVSIVIMFILVMFASVGIYVCEHNVQPDVFGSIPRAMWWAIVTLTTVGYGDVTPITPQGKIFATLITIAGVGLVSLPAGIIASGFTEQLRLRREQFALEVEELMEDGVLSQEDISKLEQDRKRLGLDEEKANLIISQLKHKEHIQKKTKRK
ncbi:MAG: ion transporter [Desulfonauticus sp.]|nr:ion transporter [Desulfonauticus sp.]